MEVTDSHIKMLQSAAQVEEAIKACHVMLTELAKIEAECRARRLKCEAWLGHMMAMKMILESHRDL